MNIVFFVMISIIVPVYNMQDYLDRCINSLLRQGLGDNMYEIILVNDGSTDNSISICQEYAAQNSQIRVFSQENRGLSATRNLGVSLAKGEYICFVDADDYLIDGGLCSLLSFCNGKYDLIRYWSKIIHKTTKDEVVLDDGRVSFEGCGIKYMKEYGLETFCWNYLYRKDFLLSHNLKFKEGLIGEDFRFMFDVLFNNPNIISIAKHIYCYVIRDGSITTNKAVGHSRKWVHDLLDSMSFVKGKLETIKDKDSVLYERCSLSLEQKMPSLFAKVLSSNYTLKEFEEVITQCKIAHLLPLERHGGPMRMILSRYAIGVIAFFTFLYKPLSLFYRYVFVPYIYPKLDRN